jgi:sec-independent protein translocase protein TatA
VDLGWPELLIILLIVLLLFGASRLPKIARSLGQAGRELKEGLNEGKDGKDAKDATDAKGDKADPAAAKPADEQAPTSDDA